jgi:flavin-dependent dehydrogenase
VNDFIFNPFGHGWHLDRARFDRSLAEEAEARGAALLVDARVAAAREGARWCVRGEAGGRALHLEADWLVDATGRAPFPFGPRRRRRVADRLAAVIGVGRAARTLDGRTVVEAVEGGWWYAATLPGGRAIATLTTDPNLVGRDFRARFRRGLAATEVARVYLGDVEDEEISVVECSTWLRAPVVADGLVAVGDAASTYDPLSSLGICKALEAGMRAARGIVAGCVNDYEAWTASSFASYLRTRARYYALEARWPDAPFWRPRRGVMRD